MATVLTSIAERELQSTKEKLVAPLGHFTERWRNHAFSETVRFRQVTPALEIIDFAPILATTVKYVKVDS